GLNARVEHINRKTEASHRVPVGHGADGPEVEARVAADPAGHDDVLIDATTAVAEQAAVDDAVTIANLRVGPVHRGRDVGQPEVFIAGARRPDGGQVELTAVDEDAVADHAQRHVVAAAEQAGAAQVAATRIGGRALAVIEVATEVVAGTSPGRLDVDTRQHRPAPLVIRRVTR